MGVSPINIQSDRVDRQLLVDAPPEVADLPAVLEMSLGMQFTAGNSVEVLCNGAEIFPAMIAAMEDARETIEFLTFVYWQGSIAGRFADILARRAADGLSVKVLLDAFGAATIDHQLVDQMRDAGAQVVWFRPLKRLRFWANNRRTHRKLLICDGRVGFTGGVGIAGEWEGDARNPREWRDTHFRVEGPAVTGLRSAFIGNWAEMVSDREFGIPAAQKEFDNGVKVMVLRSVASRDWSDVATAIRPLLHAAKSQLRITTPYFVPDQELLADLVAIARRGVTVQILTAGPHQDHPFVRWAGQYHYEALLEAGVQVIEYQPTMLHAKVITVDGHYSMIGSANFNRRSMGKDDEICLICDDKGLAQHLDAHFDADHARGTVIDLTRWRQRGWLQRLRERLVRVFESHL